MTSFAQAGIEIVQKALCTVSPNTIIGMGVNETDTEARE
jgi:hypothetical protein